MYCDMIADAVLEGLEQGHVAAGVDIGASENPTEAPGRRRGKAQAPAAEAPVEAPPTEAAPSEA
jgi:small subunit ribosomal protein S2